MYGIDIKNISTILLNGLICWNSTSNTTLNSTDELLNTTLNMTNTTLNTTLNKRDNNEINDISVLEKCNLPKLSELDLSCNKIEDILVFERCNFPKLKKLELY